mgnify:CR=1 FL=1
MAKPKSIATKKFQRRDFMEQELAYSFHLGSDKNKSKLAKKVAPSILDNSNTSNLIASDSSEYSWALFF